MMISALTFLNSSFQPAHTVASALQRLHGRYIQGGPAKVRPTLLVTFECVGKIQWFLAIWRTIL